MKLKILLLSIVLVFLLSGMALAQGFHRSATHYYIHQGNYYTTSHIFNSVVNGSSKLLLIQTGDLSVHLIAAFTAGGQTQVQLQENATVSGNGTSLTLYNHLRISSETPLSNAFHGPTVSTTGTVISKGFAPGGVSKFSRVGGTSRQTAEIVLKPNETYVVNATNTSGGAIDMGLRMSFYEMKMN